VVRTTVAAVSYKSVCVVSNRRASAVRFDDVPRGSSSAVQEPFKPPSLFELSTRALLSRPGHILKLALAAALRRRWGPSNVIHARPTRGSTHLLCGENGKRPARRLGVEFRAGVRTGGVCQHRDAVTNCTNVFLTAGGGRRVASTPAAAGARG